MKKSSPTCLDSDSVQCYPVAGVFLFFGVFLIGILYSLPVAAIYVLKDNFSVNESKLQESPGAEISVARTSFSQQPAKTIH